MQFKFNKYLYSKISLIKAAYNYTDKAFMHLDADENYYYVNIEMKNGYKDIEENEFVNEMLVQSIRHEVYLETKNIRELLLARAMSTSIVAETDSSEDVVIENEEYSENEILKDWFDENE